MLYWGAVKTPPVCRAGPRTPSLVVAAPLQRSQDSRRRVWDPLQVTPQEPSLDISPPRSSRRRNRVRGRGCEYIWRGPEEAPEEA